MKEEKHMDSTDRRQEVLGICLDTFIKKGLYETTVRDLSKALIYNPEEFIGGSKTRTMWLSVVLKKLQFDWKVH